MRILFDQGVPVPLRAFLKGHLVTTTWELRWHRIQNGELIASAERDGYDALVTTDQNLRYQQNLAGRRIAIAVLMTTSWPRIRVIGDAIGERIANLGVGAFVEIPIP